MSSSGGGIVPIDDNSTLLLDCGCQLADGFLHLLFKRGSRLPATSDIVLTPTSNADTPIVFACGARIVNEASRVILSCLVPAAEKISQIAVRVKLFQNGAAHLKVLALSADGKARLSIAAATRPSHLDISDTMKLPTLFKFERVETQLHTLLFNVNLRLELASGYRASIDEKQVPTGQDGDVLPVYTASRLWPASYALAAMLAENPLLVQGKHILELGAGLALPSLVAAKSGAASVLISDLPEALALGQLNAHANQLHPPLVRISSLDWYQPAQSNLSQEAFDVILAADCVFWPHLFTPFLNVIQHFFSISTSKTTTVLLAVTRRLDRVDRFLYELRERANSMDWYLSGPLLQISPSSFSMPTNTEIYVLGASALSMPELQNHSMKEGDSASLSLTPKTTSIALSSDGSELDGNFLLPAPQLLLEDAHALSSSSGQGHTHHRKK